TRVFADAVAEGLLARGGAKTGEEQAGEELGGDEPLAEWERELLTTTEAAAAEAPAEAAEAPTAEAAPAEAPAEAAEAAPAEAPTDAAEVPAAEEPAAEAPAEGAPVGSHAALDDGSEPEGFPIKGNAQSKKFHQAGGRWYDQTVAEIWFDTPESAEAAGFTEAGK
ncbi:MAG TPA: hypothetical protein VMZ66_10170, partial [Aeromicrobium sp.]|nr:hypothetical protein [Aeromicrobium sp.]